MKNHPMRVFPFLLCLTLVCGFLAGCGGTSSSSSPAPEQPADNPDKPLSVALILNGTIGDKSYNDLAYEGLVRAQEELGIQGKLVENKYDTTKYEPSIIEFSENPNYDVLILISFDVKEILEKVAPQYPDKRYVLLDADLDFDSGELNNCYSMNFMQNEGSFLAGALAAKMTSSGAEKTNPDKLIGFIAGGENTAINDFLIGYIEGCEYADPECKMLISYIGDFLNTAKGKEMALAQYQMGADIIFQVAGGAGMGVLEAAKEQGTYALGVDTDQYTVFAGDDQAQADAIISSMVKKVDVAVYSCIERAIADELPYGTHETLGIKENVVGVAKNEYYLAQVPQDIQDFIEETEAKVVNGEIKVSTNFNQPVEFITEARDRIKS